MFFFCGWNIWKIVRFISQLLIPTSFNHHHHHHSIHHGQWCKHQDSRNCWRLLGKILNLKHLHSVHSKLIGSAVAKWFTLMPMVEEEKYKKKARKDKRKASQLISKTKTNPKTASLSITNDIMSNNTSKNENQLAEKLPTKKPRHFQRELPILKLSLPHALPRQVNTIVSGIVLLQAQHHLHWIPAAIISSCIGWSLCPNNYSNQASATPLGATSAWKWHEVAAFMCFACSSTNSWTWARRERIPQSFYLSHPSQWLLQTWVLIPFFHTSSPHNWCQPTDVAAGTRGVDVKQEEFKQIPIEHTIQEWQVSILFWLAYCQLKETITVCKCEGPPMSLTIFTSNSPSAPICASQTSASILQIPMPFFFFKSVL